MLRSPAFGWGIVLFAVLGLILVPFVIWEESLSALAKSLLETPGGRAATAAVVVLLLLADVLLPVPSSFVAAGAVALLGASLGGLSVWLGLSAGALFGYALGRAGGRPAVERLVGHSELLRAERLMARLGAAVLVVSRGVPVLAEASVLFAGATGMPFWRFAWIAGASNAGLALAYALLVELGAGGAAEFALPFALGIAVPAVALFFAKRLDRSH